MYRKVSSTTVEYTDIPTDPNQGGKDPSNQGGKDPRLDKWRQQSPLSIHLQINAIQSTFVK
jgi:hypothetical protein